MLLRYILFVGFSFLVIVGKAQITVYGKVGSSKNSPVAGASVTLKNTYDGATTDTAGNYSFNTLEKGNFTVVVTGIGYKVYEQPVVIADKPVKIDIILKEEYTELDAVVVSAGTFEASDKKRATAVLNSLDIVTTASANADITGALKTLPGAQQVGETEGLFVRGGTAAETKIFIDGTLVNKFFYSSSPNVAGYGRFNPFLFKGTVFSTGGYSALYGQALSSAVILESIELPDRTSATLSLSVIGANAGLQYLNKKKTTSWGLTYDHTNLGLAFKVIKQQQKYYKYPAFHTVDGNFRIKTSASGMLKFYSNFSTSKFGFRATSIDSLGYKDKFALGNNYWYHNLSWKENIGKGWKLNVGISYTNNKDDIETGMQDQENKEILLEGLEFKQAAILSKANYLNAKTVIEKKLKGLSAFRFGSEYNFMNENLDYTGHHGERFETGLKENVKAVFAESDIYITHTLAAKLGLRTEYSSIIDKFNVAPRISFAYKTGRQSQASVAYGIFYQDPESKYLPSISALTFSKAVHYIAQYQKSTALTTFRAEVFYKKYNDLVKTGIVNGRPGVAVNNEGYGNAKGVELFWRDKKTIKNLDYWISYSYLDTKRDFLNFPYAIRPNFAAKHTGSLIIKKFVMPWKTGFNAAYNYASGRPYYNIVPDGDSFKFTDRGEIPDYHNVSFSVNYVPSVGKQNAKSFVVYVLSVSNLLNLKQTYGYQYSYNSYRKAEIGPPSRMFVYIGAFFSFGIDRTQDAINNNL